MRWTGAARGPGSAGARACFQSARISSARVVIRVARRAFGGIVRWTGAARGLSPPGARALLNAHALLTVATRQRRGG